MTEADKRKQDKYRATPKYRAWLKQYYIKNKTKLLTNIHKYRAKPETKEKERKNQTAYRLKIKRTVFDHYGNECRCCGETNPFFLSIDHVNNDGNLEKKNGKRPGGRMLYGKIISENFPITYQVLCMNCNFGKSKNGGICPHESEVNNG